MAGPRSTGPSGGQAATTREQAFRYVEEVVLSLLADAEAPRVVDLGCGVGASLLHFASRRPDLVGEGITISPVQVRDVAVLITCTGLSERVRVREGDFLAPHPDLSGADLVFSIEAFVHASDPAAYFRAATGLLRPGGLLVVCDDLLSTLGASASPGDALRLEEFRTGWRIGALVTPEEAIRHAALAGGDASSTA